MANTTKAKLREAVNNMDGYAQDGFGEIAAIARLALIALETPTAYKSPEIIARALHAIWGKALDIENIINCAAEEVGCNYKDEAQRRRWAAERQASGTEGAGL